MGWFSNKPKASGVKKMEAAEFADLLFNEAVVTIVARPQSRQT